MYPVFLDDLEATAGLERCLLRLDGMAVISRRYNAYLIRVYCLYICIAQGYDRIW